MTIARRVIDSSVWIELLNDGPLAKVCSIDIANTEQVIVPTLVLFEVYRKLQQKLGEALALEGAALLRRYQIADMTSEIALFAADLSLLHGLAMADSLIYAHARSAGAELLTLDNDFAQLEGVKVLR